MAQLKNTVVQGSLKVTDNIYSNTAQFSILNALTGASASTYGMGTDGQVLKSNGTNIYWSTETYTNVTQTPTTDTNADNKIFELLFSYTNDNTERTESTKKTDSLTYNPYTQALTIGKTNEGVFAPGTINGVKLHRYSSTELATGGWGKIGGLTNENKIMLVKANGANETYVPNWMTNRYSTLLFFSYSDTNAFLQCDYSTPIISFGAGSIDNSTANDPNWYIKLAGTSGKTYTFPTDSKILAATDGSNATGTWANISISGNQISDTVPITKGGTNATTALNAITNLGSVYWGVDDHASITQLQNVDLDDYSTVSNNNHMGTYIVPRGSVSATITHTPFSGSGYKLFVLRGYVSNITVQFAINNSPSPFLRILDTNDTSSSPSWVRFPYIKQSSEGTFSSVGSSTIPVYAKYNGEITACDYISLDHGGTGATTLSGARANLHIGATDSNSKLYLMGSDGQTNNDNTYTNSLVYMQSGELSAKTLGVNYGTATTKIKLQWNNTENSLDFIFV